MNRTPTPVERLKEILQGSVMSKFATQAECTAYRGAIMDCIAAFKESTVSENAAIRVPLEDARLIRNGCLPTNPNKCRNWHPELLEAARRFIAAVEAADGK